MIKKSWIVRCDLCGEVDMAINEGTLFKPEWALPRIDSVNGQKVWSIYQYSNGWQILGDPEENKHLCPTCVKRHKIMKNLENMTVEEILQALGKEEDLS